MKNPIIGLAIGTVLCASLVTQAFADHAIRGEIKQSYTLKDGSILYVFKNGKMAKENRYGNPVYLDKGEIVETAEGQKIPVVGNEIARLSLLKLQEHND
ncbi:CopK family periplasmic copper-binding protein [Noviherbaspirillum galbum]|uniref:CopK family periplasmic copper-binding protein n=1 Tax=Noviherbaspirillum galbum TaxID=2709383 RepID=A0A6B3SS24_9BURK|nr:CopK family periplasmic copper-binding protein [Noviherbaspirillum galbum]NEX63308.1 CopK family periplasmic copper-binding protein [Noviherbaspirillum galbum]